MLVNVFRIQCGAGTFLLDAADGEEITQLLKRKAAPVWARR